MIHPRLLSAVADLVAEARASGAAVPLIGIAGSQGSGKSTLARAAAAMDLSIASLSLDDAYLGRAERQDLARRLHPLFVTRGPPLTHDLEGLSALIARLRAAGPEDRTPLRTFDKLADDVAPPQDWPVFIGRPSAILLEGWCLGATPQADADLSAPVNDLEREQDADGRWRGLCNQALAQAYADLTASLDGLLFLRAPSFDRVLDWRSEQQAGLLGVAPSALSPADRAAMAGFIAHFERITRSMLSGNVAAGRIIDLDDDRSPRFDGSASIRPAP